MSPASRLRATTCLTALGLTLAAATTGVALGPAAPADAAATVFAVPTSNAGLGRITTAPDGSMWFIERNANKVGRITTTGQISEYTLPPNEDDDNADVEDLDVAPDGTVWVAYDQGHEVVALHPNGSVAQGPYTDDYPDAGEVRVAPDGVPWITMNYADSGVSRIVGGQWTWNSNSPECDDVLGRAADGSMWCALSYPGRLIHLNADASGGTTYPLPSYSGYLDGDLGSIAAGPVGSVWFTRYSSGTFVTPDGYGVVGYLDQATGAVTAWRTGSNTAPTSLVEGPDGNMWFTSVNEFHPGIGHLSASGVGAISQVGAYKPTSLTFSHDGAIWFTDSADNAVVRVTRDQLAANNVDVGSGATYSVGTVRVLPSAGTVVKPHRTIRVSHRKATFTLACAKKAKGGCHGTLTLRTATKKHVKLGKHAYSIKAGKHRSVTVKLTKKGLKRLRPGHVTKVRVELTPRGGTRPTYTHKVKLRR
ncbi:virginiamycin B lyase family protein [Nocardioides sp.]|jgi:virginiamycin B lyase|uniref:Vgb family protein n=1 Tax=Nocardioides sp. TaxID=35761 RepID=UPI002C625F76|nr:hypothetical protein [Nocardioides sp.]HVX55070.1 hypothetical protein [Nocardioides sp.]